LLGLIGGMSWSSSASYYDRLNREMERRAGAHHNPAILMASLPFAPLLAAARTDDWAFIDGRIQAEGLRLEQAGCHAVALTAVTAHRSHASLAATLAIPVPHIFDAVAAQLEAAGHNRIGLIATDFVAGSDIVHTLGADRPVLLPCQADQQAIDELIAGRLTQGIVEPGDRALLVAIVADLHRRGAGAVILACTELPSLLPIPTPPGCDLLDAVALHVESLCDLISDQRQ